MKICPNCQAQYDDTMKFCLQCGTELSDAPIQESAEPAPQAQPAPEAQYAAPQYDQAYAQYQQPQYAASVPEADPADHTAEFSAEDIEKNRIFALSVYIFGIIGIIIALLAAKESGFVKFHVRNVLKFWVVSSLLTIASVVLCWTFIVPIAAGVCLCIVAVLEIIAFVQACKGQAKEPAIIKSIKFLK